MSGGVAVSAPISVVVPVKDEADNVGPLAREIAAALAGEAHEILFVDDGSRDGTMDALMALKSELPQLRVLSHSRNLGQSRGIRTGVQAARGEIVVTLDGDGQNDPADIPKLLSALRAQADVAMVSGVRVKRQDKASRRLASRLGNCFRSALLGDSATDTGCGLKAFPRDVFLSMPYFDGLHRFLPALVRREGFEIAYVDVIDRPRRSGVSNYGFFDRLWIGIMDLAGVWWLIRRKRPTPVATEVS